MIHTFIINQSDDSIAAFYTTENEKEWGVHLERNGYDESVHYYKTKFDEGIDPAHYILSGGALIIDPAQEDAAFLAQVDKELVQSDAFRAFVKVMMDEINLLRGELTLARREIDTLKGFHSLAPDNITYASRTVDQLKNAIRDKLKAGE